MILALSGLNGTEEHACQYQDSKNEQNELPVLVMVPDFVVSQLAVGLVVCQLGSSPKWLATVTPGRWGGSHGSWRVLVDVKAMMSAPAVSVVGVRPAKLRLVLWKRLEVVDIIHAFILIAETCFTPGWLARDLSSVGP